MDVSNWRNGEAIPKVTTDEEWESAGENEEPTWCYYDNEPANGTKYRNPIGSILHTGKHPKRTIFHRTRLQIQGRTQTIKYNKEFMQYEFIQLCKKCMVYPSLSKKEIIDFYEEEMNNLLIE